MREEINKIENNSTLFISSSYLPKLRGPNIPASYNFSLITSGSNSVKIATSLKNSWSNTFLNFGNFVTSSNK